MTAAETTTLGRFGHHPDPADDFCVEVDAIDGLAAEVKVGLQARDTLLRRIDRAMSFRVGGDEYACRAKDRLREIAAELRS